MAHQTADNWQRRIRYGCTRLGATLGLETTDDTTNTILAIVLPGVVQVVTTGSSSELTQQTAQSNAQIATNTQGIATSQASGSTTAYQTLTLLQDGGQTSALVGDTFAFDTVTWTVQSATSEYVQGIPIAFVSTATGAAIS